MLTLFRNLLRSKVALVLIGLLIIAMASFGINDIFTPNLGSSLAAVGNRTVESSDLDREAEFLLNRINQNGGNSTQQDLAQSGQLQGLVYQLANRNIQAEYLERNGIRASDQAVIDVIRQNDIFRSAIHGGFDRTSYINFLNDRGQTETEFTQWLQDDLTFLAMSDGLASNVQAPQGLTELLAVFSEERRRIAYIVMQAGDLPEAVDPPSEEELREFYDAQTSIMLQPERRGFSVVAVRPEDFIHQVTISDEELENQYLAQQSRFTSPGTRTYEQFAFADETTARQALGRLLGGEDPQAVVATFNGRQLPIETNLRSAISSIDLATAVFDTPVDVWNGPIQAANGQWIIVRTTADIPGETTPLEDVADTLRAEITEYKSSRLYADSFDLIDDAVGSGGTIHEIAEMISSPVYTFPPVDERGFTRQGRRVGALLEIEGALELGFQLYPDEMSFREDGGDTQYIIRLDETVASYLPEFEEMRDELYDVVYAQKRQAAVTEYAEAMMERINQGAFLNAEAQQLNLEVDRPPMAIARSSGPQIGFPPEVMARIFGSELDQAFSIPLQRGYFIGVVEAIEVPQGEQRTAAAAPIRSNLNQMIAGEFEQAVFDVARENVNAQINDAAITTYLEQYQPVQ